MVEQIYYLGKGDKIIQTFSFKTHEKGKLYLVDVVIAAVVVVAVVVVAVVVDDVGMLKWKS